VPALEAPWRCQCAEQEQWQLPLGWEPGRQPGLRDTFPEGERGCGLRAARQWEEGELRSDKGPPCLPWSGPAGRTVPLLPIVLDQAQQMLREAGVSLSSLVIAGSFTATRHQESQRDGGHPAPCRLTLQRARSCRPPSCQPGLAVGFNRAASAPEPQVLFHGCCAS
jgi:hypothetical protein